MVLDHTQAQRGRSRPLTGHRQPRRSRVPPAVPSRRLRANRPRAPPHPVGARGRSGLRHHAPYATTRPTPPRALRHHAPYATTRRYAGALEQRPPAARAASVGVPRSPHAPLWRSCGRIARLTLHVRWYAWLCLLRMRRFQPRQLLLLRRDGRLDCRVLHDNRIAQLPHLRRQGLEILHGRFRHCHSLAHVHTLLWLPVHLFHSPCPTVPTSAAPHSSTALTLRVPSRGCTRGT